MTNRAQSRNQEPAQPGGADRAAGHHAAATDTADGSAAGGGADQAFSAWLDRTVAQAGAVLDRLQGEVSERIEATHMSSKAPSHAAPDSPPVRPSEATGQSR